MTESYDDKANDTLQKVLNETIDTLRKDDKTDIDLLDILITRIVTLHPSKISIDQALTDIKALADRRTES